MKIFVNITTFVGISAGAIHYYAKISKNDSPENIYHLLNNSEYGKSENEDLRRIIYEKEAIFLNKKDGRGSKWESGMTTLRFNSVKEIKESALKQYPNDDIAFLHDWELKSEDIDVIVRIKEEFKYTGQEIKINHFTGFSTNFKNIINGTTHKVIETPERYKNKELLFGYWINGLYEPALVLNYECELIPNK